MEAPALLECLLTVVLTAQSQSAMQKHTTEIFPSGEQSAVLTTQQHAFAQRLECGTYRIVVDGSERRTFTLIYDTETTIDIGVD